VCGAENLCAAEVSAFAVRMPALLTRMCSGPDQAATKAATESGSARSSRATRIAGLPVLARARAVAKLSGEYLMR
jgi:hypothetical protein